jgi:hypothetical protein
MRSGETVVLPEITLDTTIHEIKTQYVQKAGGLQIEKIKLLLNKKPAADLKTLKDLGVAGDVEISVMLMAGAGTGGSAAATPRAQSPAVVEKIPAQDKMDVDEPATSAPDSEKAAAEVQTEQASGAAQVLETDEFWADLQGFLSQRLRDEGEGERLAKLFKQSVKPGEES